MILWTIQHLDAWRNAEQAGVLRGDARRAWRMFREPYRWMVAVMSHRICRPPRGVRHPIWAWLQYENERRKRPDLRRAGHLPAGTSGVLIEFAAPDHQVLLSDFELWHYVLNRWYLPSTLRESREMRQTNGYHLENSWYRIFDLDWELKDIAVPRPEKSIQATLWEVPLTSVRSIQHFRAHRGLSLCQKRRDAR
jgi:hypothetical protein